MTDDVVMTMCQGLIRATYIDPDGMTYHIIDSERVECNHEEAR